jgi:hypothetical protein
MAIWSILKMLPAGGRAHQYKNWEDCKVWLENELND